jgi:hypothetical protein
MEHGGGQQDCGAGLDRVIEMLQLASSAGSDDLGRRFLLHRPNDRQIVAGLGPVAGLAGGYSSFPNCTVYPQLTCASGGFLCNARGAARQSSATFTTANNNPACPIAIANRTAILVALRVAKRLFSGCSASEEIAAARIFAAGLTKIEECQDELRGIYRRANTVH